MSDVASPRGERAGLSAGFVLLHVVLPIVVGGLMYIMWRDTGMLMFRWAEIIGLSGVVDWLREVGGAYGSYVPDWLMFSLPDGCWVYSCTAFFARLWREETSMLRWFWIGIGPVLAIGGEFGQLVPGFVPGTFDLVDLIAYFIAAAASFYVGWFGFGPRRDVSVEGE